MSNTAATATTTAAATQPTKAPAAVRKSPPVKKPAAKARPQAVAKPKLAKPVAPPPVAAKPAAEAAKPAKAKLVRDSFTMPEAEYALLAHIKQRVLALAHPAKKSEVLRAGVLTLNALGDPALLAALQAVTPLKTGRPKAKKADKVEPSPKADKPAAAPKGKTKAR